MFHILVCTFPTFEGWVSIGHLLTHFQNIIKTKQHWNAVITHYSAFSAGRENLKGIEDYLDIVP